MKTPRNLFLKLLSPNRPACPDDGPSGSPCPGSNATMDCQIRSTHDGTVAQGVPSPAPASESDLELPRLKEILQALGEAEVQVGAAAQAIADLKRRSPAFAVGDPFRRQLREATCATLLFNARTDARVLARNCAELRLSKTGSGDLTLDARIVATIEELCMRLEAAASK